MISLIRLAIAFLFFLVSHVRSQKLGDWVFCSSSSQCNNGCCSSKYSNDGKLKCTPVGGFNPAICVAGSALGDWAFCSSSSACQNGCCSSRYSNDGKLKCTPLNGGFNAAICVNGSTPPPPPPPPSPLPSTPRGKLLGFLQSISGSKTMAGHHNREAEIGDFIAQMTQITGRSPAFWSGDFLYQSSSIRNRQNVINNLINGWRGGAIINLMYHACPPTSGEACEWEGTRTSIKSKLTDSQWEDLITDGGSLNRVWKSRLDAIAPYFQQLKNAGISTLFRPHHEMNQGVFWWSKAGSRGSAALFRITRDYLTKVKGLDNIVWVWSVQDIPNTNWNDYNPGDAYWDVMSLDFYNGDGYTNEKYNAMLAIAGNKPIAIGECDQLPTASQLASQPRWVFFMGWAELVKEKNNNAAIISVYSAPNVLTRDEMPAH